jgi:hypothetical protein
MRSVEALQRFHAPFPERRPDRRIEGDVTASHRMAELDEQPGQRAHPSTGHRHDVNSAQGRFRIHQARFLAWA